MLMREEKVAVISADRAAHMRTHLLKSKPSLTGGNAPERKLGRRERGELPRCRLSTLFVYSKHTVDGPY